MSLGGKYVFATVLVFVYVHLDKLKLCIVSVNGRGYVNECYVILVELPSLFVFLVCAYGTVVWSFR